MRTRGPNGFAKVFAGKLIATRPHDMDAAGRVAFAAIDLGIIDCAACGDENPTIPSGVTFKSDHPSYAYALCLECAKDVPTARAKVDALVATVLP